MDIFCGVGGLSLGFKRAGFKISAGIDLDETGRYAFERYTGGTFVKADVATVDAAVVRKLLGRDKPRILVGCAPCQSFSEYNKKSRGSAWNLLPSFARLIEGAKPDIVSMENVSRLVEFREGQVFSAFVNRLSRAGFNVSWSIVSGADYGISQRRKRLILFASRRGFIDIIPPTHVNHISLKKVIGHLPPLVHGKASRHDRFHCTQSLSDTNLMRLKNTPPGGAWRDWPKHLRLACHNTEAGKEFGSVYGRLTWDGIGPTITTQFYKIGTGRFGHPSQHRALSLREGGIIQTFPRRFQFVAPSDDVAIERIGRLIGNAVPVRLGEIIAQSIRAHIEDYPV